MSWSSSLSLTVFSHQAISISSTLLFRESAPTQTQSLTCLTSWHFSALHVSIKKKVCEVSIFLPLLHLVVLSERRERCRRLMLNILHPNDWKSLNEPRRFGTPFSSSPTRPLSARQAWLRTHTGVTNHCFGGHPMLHPHWHEHTSRNDLTTSLKGPFGHVGAGWRRNKTAL